MDDKAKKISMVAKTFWGLEDILAEELKAMGARILKVQKRTVIFEGDKELMYRANLCCRVALRILKPLQEFKVYEEEDLYNEIKEIPWEDYMDKDGTLAVDSVIRSSPFNHSRYVALKTKDAIVDRFRENTGVRPSVSVEQPDLRISLYIHQNRCMVYLDSSGESLHRRGYRKDKDKAPLNEVTAAGLVILSGWDAQSPFVDPMCGSGTIAIEAALIAMNIAPGKYRNYFGFQRWTDFDAKLWQKVLNEALENEKKDLDFKIIASDVSSKVIGIAKKNIGRTGLEDIIHLESSDMGDLQPPEGPGVAIMNPPYGERMGQEDEVELLYQDMGDTFKQKYPGYKTWIISSNKDALKKVGLRANRKFRLFNGSLECNFYGYSIYKGSKENKKN